MDATVPLLAVAYSADLVVGDPEWFPHPVRGMGFMIRWGERLLRALVPWERLGGFLLVLLIVASSFVGSRWLLQTIAAQSSSWGFLASALLLWSCLSTRDLAVESRRVYRALGQNDLALARRQVSRIVGRDTDRLDEAEVVRASLETIAESTMDGIVSPLFYFVVGGVPGAVAYKAINTLDSMIGHRSARYIRFGWAAATLDTWANWLPARCSALVISIGAWMSGYRTRESWHCAWSHHLRTAPDGSRCVHAGRRRRLPQVVGWRDGHGGPVPNAGIPVAALAGALGVQLGGINWYQGQPFEMPRMGHAARPLTSQRIPEAIHLMYASSIVAWLLTMAFVMARA